jgi:hypothetical protein
MTLPLRPACILPLLVSLVQGDMVPLVYTLCGPDHMNISSILINQYPGEFVAGPLWAIDLV